MTLEPVYQTEKQIFFLQLFSAVQRENGSAGNGWAVRFQSHRVIKQANVQYLPYVIAMTLLGPGVIRESSGRGAGWQRDRLVDLRGDLF